MRGYHHYPLDREPTMDEVEASRILFHKDLKPEDRTWFREQLAMADMPTPEVDMGFLETEAERTERWKKQRNEYFPWPLWILIGVPAIAGILAYMFR